MQYKVTATIEVVHSFEASAYSDAMEIADGLSAYDYVNEGTVTDFAIGHPERA